MIVHLAATVGPDNGRPTGRAEHPLHHADLNLDELGRRLADQVGAGVCVISRPPGPDGPGMLRFEHPDAAELVIDPRTVTATIDTMLADQERDRSRAAEIARRPSPSQVWLDSLRRCLADADAAATTEERVDAVLAWMQRAVDAALSG